MEEKNRKEKQELDTETTFADMNVEGFSWYDPSKKKNKQKIKIEKKEFWAMVRGAFEAYLPLFGVLIGVGVVIFLIAYFWLR